MFGMAIACAWGFAEATLFFVVPDVWLSYLALKNLRRALLACVWTLAGALLGAAALFFWSTVDFDRAHAVVSQVPAVGAEMVRESGTQLVAHGLWALWMGMIRGVPYKTFVVEAPRAGIGLLPLLAVSVPVRLIRFVAVSVATRFIAARLPARLSERAKLAVLIAFWATFYAVYFAVHYQK